jgi:hypothetical protein
MWLEMHRDRLATEKGEMFAPLPYDFNEHYHRGTAMKLNRRKKLCECGCGEEVNPGRRFIAGHQRRGVKLSEEHKSKIGEAHKGKTLSKEHREKLSQAKIGKTLSKEHREKLSIVMTGHSTSKETKIKIGIANSKPRTDGYCEAWSDKEYVEDLRGSACEACGITSLFSIHISGRRLATHHKTGKKECSPDDIQTVCGSCHAKLHNALRWAKEDSHASN